jgi:AbrB family looped-hinge helix DNA binding protein
MSTVLVSTKRQIVLPAELCRQLAIAPGAKVEVELSPAGDGLIIRPATARKKPASVLFGRLKHKGTPIAIEEMSGLAAARKRAQAGKL